MRYERLRRRILQAVVDASRDAASLNVTRHESGGLGTPRRARYEASIYLPHRRCTAVAGGKTELAALRELDALLREVYGVAVTVVRK